MVILCSVRGGADGGKRSANCRVDLIEHKGGGTTGPKCAFCSFLSDQALPYALKVVPTNPLLYPATRFMAQANTRETANDSVD
jgi:hypothetical protein